MVQWRMMGSVESIKDRLNVDRIASSVEAAFVWLHAVNVAQTVCSNTGACSELLPPKGLCKIVLSSKLVLHSGPNVSHR